MNCKKGVELSRRGEATLIRGVWFGVLLGMGVAGCADHRISLDEFLAMQEQLREAATTTVPPEEEEAVRTRIDRQLGPYRVGPADVLVVTITGSDQVGLFPPTPVRVHRNGEIDLPIVGTLKVADLELEDVEDTIHGAYVPGVVKDATVHVELLNPDYTNVLVVGAVTAPGLVQLRRTERDMLHAIVAAGGVSELASGRGTLRRVRSPAEEATLDLTDPEGLHAALALEPLENGDIVTVHAAIPNTVFVGGLVNAPQAQMYSPGVEMTILQAIAAAGGLRTEITPREGTLIRRMPDGTDAHVKLDLDRIATGKDTNLLLAAGDVLWVPHTAETRIQDFINRNFFFRAGISANVSYNVTGVEFLNRRSMQTGRYGGYGTSGGLQDAFDPYGFLTRGTGIQTLVNQPAPQP